MLTNAYSASLRDYRLDVENCKFSSKYKWGNHAKALYYTTFDVKEEAYIAFQCQLSDGSIWDCVLFGCDKSGKEHAAFIMLGEGPFSKLNLQAPEGIEVHSYGYSYNHFSGGAKAGEAAEDTLPMYFVDHQANLGSELEDMFNGGYGKEVFSKFE